MYVQDYDEVLPFCQINNYSGLGETHWPYLLKPYVKNNHIFDCPSYTARYVGGPRYEGAEGPAYSQNIYLGSETAGNSQPLHSLAQIDSPSETPLHWDHASTNALGWFNANYIADRHNGQLNLSFVDGHAKAMSKTAALGDLQADPTP